MHPRLLILRPIWLFPATLAFGGAFLVPWSLLSFGGARLGALVSAPMLLIAVFSCGWALVMARPIRLDGWIVWYIDFQQQMLRTYWGLDSAEFIFESVEMTPVRRRLDALLQAVVFVPLGVIVSVTRAGFSRSIDTWIQAEVWHAFAQQLAVLEDRRQGEARVESISPGELRLVVKSVDRAGHLGVEGHVGTRRFDAEVSLRFSMFTFDPAQLAACAREAREVSKHSPH